MPMQDNEDKRIADQPVPDMSVQKSGKLLPFLKAKAEHHQSRIDSLDEKTANQTDKIDRNKAKIEALTAKADKLEDTNRMLKATFGNIPLIKGMIERNEERIRAIREEKIPKREQKIKDCESKIGRFSAKRERITHKLDRVIALNDTIRSFSIGFNKQRREAFADAMDRLNEATYNCLSDKRKSLVEKKNSIIETYNSPETSVVDKYKLQAQINDLSERIQSVDDRMEKIWQPDEFYMMQSDDTLDAQVKLTSDKLADMADSGTVDIPNLAEKTLFVALETEELDRSQIAEIADRFNDQFVPEIEDTQNWLADMVADGKAEFTEDGDFKVNPDYYKELPRNGRHIEPITEEQAVAVMSALTKVGINFSAASRGDDKVSITVSKRDINALNDIMQESVGRTVKAPNPHRKEENYQTVNPDYYKSLPKDQRHTRVEPKDVAREIVRGLQRENISYSAVVRKNDTVAITVSKDNAQAFKQISDNVKGERAVEFVNPEFFKQLPKQERFTQRMDEGQARKKSAELAAQGVEHSAVFSGEKSAVTVAKKDSRWQIPI